MNKNLESINKMLQILYIENYYDGFSTLFYYHYLNYSA